MEGHTHFQVNNSNKGSSSKNKRNSFRQLTKETYTENATKKNKEKGNVYYCNENIKTVTNDKTMENWLKMTENKGFFKHLEKEDTEEKNIKNLNKQSLNLKFYKGKRNDENKDYIFKNCDNNNNNIDTSRNTSSIDANHEHYIDRNNSNTSFIDSINSHRSNAIDRNSSEFSNTNHVDDSAFNNENTTCVNNNEVKEEKTIHTWIMQTENPDLYKNINDLEEDAKYREVTKYVDLENADNDIVDKILAQNVLMNKYDEMKNKRKKKRAYCLFYNGSDCDEYATPSKKSGNFFSKSYEDRTYYENNFKEDTIPTSSIFNIQNIDNIYSNPFSQTSVEKRESCEINKNTDSFLSDRSVTPAKIRRNHYNKNVHMTKNEIHSFIKNTIEYETPMKFSKGKLDTPRKNIVELQIELINGIKNTKNGNIEENGEHQLNIKSNKHIELEMSSSVNTTKEASSHDSDSLNCIETKGLQNGMHKLEAYDYFQANSDTEITTSPEIIEKKKLTKNKNQSKTLFKNNINRNINQWNFF